MTEVIASLELLERVNGTERHVTAEVARPVRRSTGEWSCEVHLVGSGETWAPIRGDDSLQALALALDFLRRMLALRPGLRFRDGEEFAPDALFRGVDT